MQFGHVLIITTALTTFYNVYAIGPVCPPKGFFNCTEKAAEEAKCEHNVTINPCTYCWTCIRYVNETCGGVWGNAGKCKDGLVCLNKWTIGELPGICSYVIPISSTPDHTTTDHTTPDHS